MKINNLSEIIDFPGTRTRTIKAHVARVFAARAHAARVFETQRNGVFALCVVSRGHSTAARAAVFGSCVGDQAREREDGMEKERRAWRRREREEICWEGGQREER